MNRILIHLPHDRREPGHLELVDDRDVPLFDCECLGKSDSQAAVQHDNVARDPVHAFGDTPTGQYAPAAPLALGPSDVHFASMGPWFIPLIGTAGDALRAKTYGRTGLAIHAGRGDAKLMPTHGCVRLEQHDMDALVAAMSGQEAEISIDEKPMGAT